MTKQTKKESPVAFTQGQYDDLDAYIGKKVKFLSHPESGHCLNPASQAKLAKNLWVIAVKSMERHDPMKSPLMPFVKTIISMSMFREAKRLYKEQCDRAESPWGDDSLDAPISKGEEDSATVGDLIAEDAMTVLRRKRGRMVRQTLRRLPWTEQLALETLMYDDSRKNHAANFLGMSRPTLDAYIRNEAAPHFAALWNG